jgi:hypothetical protein
MAHIIPSADSDSASAVNCPIPARSRAPPRTSRPATRQMARSRGSRARSPGPAPPVTAVGSVPTLAIEADDSVFASGDFTKSDTYTLRLDGDWKGVRALRLEVLPDERLPTSAPAASPMKAPSATSGCPNFKVLAGTNTHELIAATQSYASGDNTAAKALDDDLQSGWSINGGQGQSHNAVFRFDPPLDHEGALQIEMIFERYYAAGLGRFRLWATRDDDAVATPPPHRHPGPLARLKTRPAADASRPAIPAGPRNLPPLLRLDRPATHRSNAMKSPGSPATCPGTPPPSSSRNAPPAIPAPPHPSPRRVPPTHRTRRTRGASVPARLPPTLLPTVWPGPMAGLARQPPHPARRHEPRMAGLLRARPRPHHRGFRLSRRTPHPSGVARLAGPRVRPTTLVPQTDAPAHRPQRHLPPIQPLTPDSSSAIPKTSGSPAAPASASRPNWSATPPSPAADC